MIKFFKYTFQNFLSDKNFSEVLSGSAWALGASIIATIFGLISSIIIARFYGAELLGIVAVINSFLMLSAIITVLGTDTSILRFIPEHFVKYSPTSAYKVYRKILVLVIVTSIVTGSIFYWQSRNISLLIFRKSDWSFYIALASTFILFKSLTQLNTQAVRGLKLVRSFALMQTFPQGFNLFFIVLLPFFFTTENIPVYSLIGSFVFTGIAGLGFMGRSFRRLKNQTDVVHILKVREILSISIPMLMTSTMFFIIGQTGVLVLGIFRSEAEVGYYAISVKIATLTSFILNAINSIAAPKFSELFHLGKIDELFYIAKKSAKLIFWTTAPILMGLIFFGKPVLCIVFGNDFTVSYLPLVVLLIGQFVNSISGSSGYFMNMTGNEKPFKNIILVSALINVLLSFLLIPNMEMIGASIAAAVSLVFWNGCTLLYIKIKFGKTTGYIPLKKFCT